jgi:hypothetical protein
MKVVSMSRSRSGLAWARCSSRKRTGSKLGATFIAVSLFREGLGRFFSQDHAVTVTRSRDTLARIRYSTLKDATAGAAARSVPSGNGEARRILSLNGLQGSGGMVPIQ